MIVNKKSRLALIALALTMLLPLSSAFAADSEAWKKNLNKLESNAWNTYYPVAAQLGTLAAATVVAALEPQEPTQNVILGSGVVAATILAHYLRDRQSSEQKNSSVSQLTKPNIVNAFSLAIIGCSINCKRGDSPVIGIIEGLVSSFVLNTFAKIIYDQLLRPSEDLQPASSTPSGLIKDLVSSILPI